jgi:hypothetical protein
LDDKADPINGFDCSNLPKKHPTGDREVLDQIPDLNKRRCARLEFCDHQRIQWNSAASEYWRIGVLKTWSNGVMEYWSDERDKDQVP